MPRVWPLMLMISSAIILETLQRCLHHHQLTCGKSPPFQSTWTRLPLYVILRHALRIWQKAESIFLEMPLRDKFSWSAMISGYVQGVCSARALPLAEQMLHSHVEPNEVTLVSLLYACSHLGALDRGRQIHSHIEQNTEKRDASLMNALINMYAKCGCFDTAQQVFDGMLQRDTHSWNAMIGVFRPMGVEEKLSNSSIKCR